ncbi:MAG: AI-2E family transporter [Tissierellia bacterium]|nr:AI-2E family transporter [Tissierellia bacterium]
MENSKNDTLIDDHQKSSQNNDSPPWGWATKLVVGILFIVGFLALIIRFKTYTQMLLIAFIISFLLNPLVKFFHKTTRVKWRLSATIIYVLLAGLVVWAIAAGGSGLAGQIQKFFTLAIDNVDTITEFFESWSDRTISWGVFNFTIPHINFDVIGKAISESLQSIVTSAANITTTVVGTVGGVVVNIVITYMISFFITSESEGVGKKIINISLPGYEKDFQRLGQEIGRIFNSFIRGEFFMVATSITIYTIFLGAMGLPYFFVLALIAGFGRFIPYIGAGMGWVAFFIGALVQSPTPFGMEPFFYALLVIAIAVVLDMIMDHVIQPRVMGNSLHVHPAAIMISALIMAQLFGLLGLMLAAPALATLKLLLQYCSRKIFDQDPWEGFQYYQKPAEPKLIKWLRRIWRKIRLFLIKIWARVKSWFKKTGVKG